MVVLCLSKCPPALRGDITRWLFEIDAGIYTGNVSARVRDKLWERVIENAKDGRATMVYSAKNEQRLEFRVYNSEWQPIDFDGIKLMLKPHRRIASIGGIEKKGQFSTASTLHNAKKFSKRTTQIQNEAEQYAVVDVETTGLSYRDDRIIEIGAIIVDNRGVQAEFDRLIKIDGNIPSEISSLTGITDAMLLDSGVDEAVALRELLGFIGNTPIVMHNMAFDMNFLRRGLIRCGLPILTNKVTDTVTLAKRLLDEVDNFKLTTLAQYFQIVPEGAHRSINDCITTMKVFNKLIEK